MQILISRVFRHYILQDRDINPDGPVILNLSDNQDALILSKPLKPLKLIISDPLIFIFCTVAY